MWLDYRTGPFGDAEANGATVTATEVGRRMTVRNQTSGISVPKSVFREYDIRGQASPSPNGGEITLTVAVARAIGQALGSRHGVAARALVTGDNRVSTPALREAVAAGLCDVGLSVDLAVEEIPTGAASWLALANGWVLVVQVTGSHTPAPYNGLKITERQTNGRPSDEDQAVPSALYGEALAQLYSAVSSGDVRAAPHRGVCSETSGLLARYRGALLDAAKTFLGAPGFQYPKRIVLDAGNGLGACLKPVLEALGAEVHGLFLESDGTFPNHPADPLLTRTDVPYEESGLRHASETVRELNRQESSGARWIGVVTDGDGDRSGLVDELGDPVRPELVGFLFYQRYLSQSSKALRYLAHQGRELLVAADIRATSVFKEVIGSYSGVVGRFIPAGYPIHRSFARGQIERLLSIADGLAAGSPERAGVTELAHNYVSAEVSGHYFFNVVPRWPSIVVDDGLLAALRLLQILDRPPSSESGDAQADAPLRRLVRQLPTRCTSEEIRLRCDDARKFEIASEAKAAAMAEFADDILPTKAIEIVDGVPTQPLDSGLVDVDGFRMQFRDDSMFLIRPSNTSPAMTFRFEGHTPEVLRARREDVVRLLSRYKGDIEAVDSLLA